MVSNSEIATWAIILRVPELIFLIIISLTMLAVNGKLYWILNVICAFLKVILGCSYKIVGENDGGVSMLLATDIVISAIFLLETLFEAFDHFY
jgi:hypothetical protein